MTTLSGPALYQLAVNAGFPAADAKTAAAIALAESSGNTNAVSSTNDYGAWQINRKAHPTLFQTYVWTDAQQNADMAYQVWMAAGRSFTPWTTYKNGRYKVYLGQIVGASGVDPVINAGASATGSASGLVNSGIDVSVLTTAVSDVSQASFWQRVGMFIGGVVLFMIGLHGLLKLSTTYQAGVSHVRAAVETAAFA